MDTEKQPLPKLTEKAVELAKGGLSCAEAVLTAYGPPLGLEEELAMKLAGGLGGGVALSGEVCGALNAAVMVIGLRYGAKQASESYNRQNTYIVAGELLEKFQDKRGSTICRELCVGHEMSTPEKAKRLRESGLPELMIRTAAEALDELL